MWSVPAVALAAVIASRSEIWPSAPGLRMSAATEVVVPSIVSAVVLTTRPARGPNSDVLP